jgi:hypothetical protein
VRAAKLLKNDLRYSETAIFFSVSGGRAICQTLASADVMTITKWPISSQKMADQVWGLPGRVDGTGTEFVRLNVDVIVTGGNAAVAVKQRLQWPR